MQHLLHLAKSLACICALVATHAQARQGSQPDYATIFANHVTQSLATLHPGGLPASDNIAVAQAMVELDMPTRAQSGWCCWVNGVLTSCNPGTASAYVVAHRGGIPCSSETLPAAALQQAKNLATQQLPPSHGVQVITYWNFNTNEAHSYIMSQAAAVPVAQNYCTTTQARIAARPILGGALVTAYALPPNVPCLVYAGTTQAQAPFGNGVRCVGGTIVRLGVANTQSGQVDVALLAGDPLLQQINAGSPRYFQAWYRQAAIPGAGFNLTDGVRLQPCQ